MATHDKRAPRGFERRALRHDQSVKRAPDVERMLGHAVDEGAGGRTPAPGKRPIKEP